MKKGKKIKQGKRAVVSSDPQPENAAPGGIVDAGKQSKAIPAATSPAAPAEEGKQLTSDLPPGIVAGEAKRATAASERYPALKMRIWRSRAQHQSNMLHRYQYRHFQKSQQISYKRRGYFRNN